MPNTIRLHLVLKAPPAKIYKASLDPDAMARWLPPYGFTGKVHEIDPRVGGRYRMSFTTSRPATRTASAASTWSSCLTRRSSTPTASTTRTCPAR